MIRVADRIATAVEAVHLNQFDTQPGTHRHGCIGVLLDTRWDVAPVE